MITIDFETYYDKDFSLSKLTTEEYVRDQRFEVIGVSVKVNDARDAIEQLAAGKEVEFPQRPVFGCSIKWKHQTGRRLETMKEWMEQPVKLEAIDATNKAIVDLNKQIAKLEKQTATEPRTFQGKLEKQSRLVELGGLRDQRDAMLKTREQLAKGVPAVNLSRSKLNSSFL